MENKSLAPERLVTEREMAKLLSVNEKTLYHWRNEKRIPFFKPGKAVRYKVSDVMKALEKYRHDSIGD